MESSGFDFKAPQFLESLVEEAQRGEDAGVCQFFGVSSSVNENKTINETFDDQSSDEENDVYETPRAPIAPRVYLKAKRRSSGIPSSRPNTTESNADVSSADSSSSSHSSETEALPWKTHKMETRADTVKLTPTINLRSRSVVCEGLKRPRETQSLSNAVQRMSIKRAKLTIAKTPKLMTKFRTRPRTALTQEEREELIMDEIKKHPIKPLPLNEKILHSVEACSKPPTRPATVPKPFHLSDVKKKVSMTVEEEPFRFKAKPYIPTTNRTSLRPRKYSVASDSGDGSVVMKTVDGIILLDHQRNNTSTTIKPFSFDERDKERFKKKEEKIKKIIEDETKGREFHAKPLPSYLKSNRTMSVISEEGTCADDSLASLRTTRSTKRDDEKENKRFVAQPPTVLHKKPFQPKKPEKQPLEPLNIQLHTEKRAQERAEQEAMQNMLLLKNLELKEELPHKKSA